MVKPATVKNRDHARSTDDASQNVSCTRPQLPLLANLKNAIMALRKELLRTAFTSIPAPSTTIHHALKVHHVLPVLHVPPALLIPPVPHVQPAPHKNPLSLPNTSGSYKTSNYRMMSNGKLCRKHHHIGAAQDVVTYALQRKQSLLPQTPLLC